MFAGTISLAIFFSCIYLVRNTFQIIIIFSPYNGINFLSGHWNHKITKMFWHLVPLCVINRETCWRRGRKLCFVAFLYSYWCRCKRCLMANFTKKCCFSWSFWCCFWFVYHKCSCKGNYLKRNDSLLSLGIEYNIFNEEIPSCQMSWDWRKILEVLILGQFVIEKVVISSLFALMFLKT